MNKTCRPSSSPSGGSYTPPVMIRSSGSPKVQKSFRMCPDPRVAVCLPRREERPRVRRYHGVTFCTIFMLFLQLIDMLVLLYVFNFCYGFLLVLVIKNRLLKKWFQSSIFLFFDTWTTRYSLREYPYTTACYRPHVIVYSV